MDYEFGDIVDCKKVTGINHFLLILGETKDNKGVFYYIITSRTYKVFIEVLDFFNDCIQDKYQIFYHHFGKERNKAKIYPSGSLSDAFFLDGRTDYNGYLGTGSMIMVNKDPESLDKEVLEIYRASGEATICTRLTKCDSMNLRNKLLLSDNISKQHQVEIGKSYAQWKNK